MISGYINKETSQVVVVAINCADEARNMNFSNYEIASVYVTSKTKKLKQETQQEIHVVLEPRSISTLTGH